MGVRLGDRGEGMRTSFPISQFWNTLIIAGAVGMGAGVLLGGMVADRVEIREVAPERVTAHTTLVLNGTEFRCDLDLDVDGPDDDVVCGVIGETSSTTLEGAAP